MKRNLTKVTLVKKSWMEHSCEYLGETANITEITDQEQNYERGQKAFCHHHFRIRLPFLSLIHKKIYFWRLSVQESWPMSENLVRKGEVKIFLFKAIRRFWFGFICWKRKLVYTVRENCFLVLKSIKQGISLANEKKNYKLKCICLRLCRSKEHFTRQYKGWSGRKEGKESMRYFFKVGIKVHLLLFKYEFQLKIFFYLCYSNLL